MSVWVVKKKKIVKSFVATHILSVNTEFKICGILFSEIPIVRLVLFLIILEVI